MTHDVALLVSVWKDFVNPVDSDSICSWVSGSIAAATSSD